jgi:hypothetical protein
MDYPVLHGLMVSSGLNVDAQGQAARVVPMARFAAAALADQGVTGMLQIPGTDSEAYRQATDALVSKFDPNGNGKLHANDVADILGDTTLDRVVQPLIAKFCGGGGGGGSGSVGGSHRRRRASSVGTPPPEEWKALPETERALKSADECNKLTSKQSLAVIKNCTQAGAGRALQARGKLSAVCVGNTGAGKSTVCNFIRGCRMEMVLRKKIAGLSGGGKVCRVKPDTYPKELAPIGHSTQSETFLPNVVSLEAVEQLSNWIMLDCPGECPSVATGEVLRVDCQSKKSHVATIVVSLALTDLLFCFSFCRAFATAFTLQASLTTAVPSSTSPMP